MKELPIRFSGPMVKAILDGSKTQTRRVVKQDREGLLDCEPHPAWDAFWQCVACPYGKPGDRLWVASEIPGPRTPRILLEITDVRVEKLQDISEADAQAEGVKVDGNGHAVRDDVVNVGGARTAFAELWESINGPDSWAANPWVWVVAFRRIEP